jgi:hypothetical protein
MTSLICVATACGEDDLDIIDNLRTGPTMMINESDPGLSPVEKYQLFYEFHGGGVELFCYIHSDVVIHEDRWLQRVEKEFQDPSVAIVGFGGATAIGLPCLYKEPYRMENLIRRNYASNQSDWQVHGTRETGSKDVAVVDGFAMCVRTEFLKQIGGWTQVLTHFHCYDLWLCLVAIRHGWKVRMVGINCTHKGGGTSTSPQYKKWCEDHGTDMGREHAEPHLRFYREFTDLLPIL